MRRRRENPPQGSHERRHHLRHQGLRHDAEGPRLAGQPRRGLRFLGLQGPGVPRDKLAAWAGEVGWETLLNRAGTTFRKLPDREKEGLGAAKAIALMLGQPSMIKRPVLDLGGKLLVGFRPEAYETALG